MHCNVGKVIIPNIEYLNHFDIQIKISNRFLSLNESIEPLLFFYTISIPLQTEAVSTPECALIVINSSTGVFPLFSQ